MTGDVRIAVVGAGLIGRRHVVAIGRADGVRVAVVIDPDEAAADVAQAAGVPHLRALDDLSDGVADAVILATPNALHLHGALHCIQRGLPVLVEKPLATTGDDAARIVVAGDAAGVAVLTGHHRRHNPIVAAARAMIVDGAIGRPVSAQGLFWLAKPDSYFETAWRCAPGAGPVFLNLVHDIDLLRYFLGEVRAVQAVETRAVRGHPVEDAIVILMEFDTGVLATMNVADCIPAPWSWELTAAENPAYAATGQGCYTIGGTLGALELPALRLWRHEGGGGWHAPISATTVPCDRAADPLVVQAAHFGRVVRGTEVPLVSGRDGARTLQVAEAIKTAAARGQRVAVTPI